MHLKGQRDPTTGDWQVSWIRRTRSGGDSWGYEVPLGEEVERYAAEILDPATGTVLRSIDVLRPTFTYTAAAQADDFGSPATVLRVVVTQTSQAYGRGIPAEATFHV